MSLASHLETRLRDYAGAPACGQVQSRAVWELQWGWNV